MRPTPLSFALLPLALLVATSPGTSQIVVAPGFQSSVVAGGIPGARHQVATEASGTIWVSEEGVVPGFGPGALHRIDVTGAVTPNVVPWIASPGQMLRNPADGLVYFVHHWVGALEHNHLVRIDPPGTATTLIDVLWGVGHGLALDGSGVFHMGTGGTGFAAPTIYTIPNPPGSSPEVPWDPGVADNGFLAWAGANGALVASALPGSGTVDLVQPGQGTVPAFTYVPLSPSGQVIVRSLVANPFGPGWLVSVVETDPVTGTIAGSVHFFGPGGPFQIATASALPAPGDFAINDDGAGGLLLVSAGTVHRIVAGGPPVAPGTLLAPASAMQGTPVFVTVAGRPFSAAPFILAADLPLGPPSFPGGVLPIPPWGVAHTSLGIQPTFVVLEDGIPVFAPSATPAGFLPHSGQRTLGFLVPPITTAITVVLEAYILDSAAPNGLFWITNPAFLTLTP
jgi:hypothetical protein